MTVPGSIDAWVEAELNAFFSTNGTQTKRYRAYCKIVINGRDVTSRLDPYLMSVTIRNGGVWEATIELDDRDGRLEIPPFQASVEIDLGWSSESNYRAFTGWVSDVMHGFGRSLGGRRMFVEAKTIDQTSKVKTPFQDYVGDGAPPGQTEGTKIPFLQAFQQFAKNAGMTAVVGPSLLNVSRDYWAMSNESIMQWGTRHADELGAKFFIEGSNVMLGRQGDFPGPNLIGKWGDNLISWRLHPYAARPAWSGSSQQTFDHVNGLWQQIGKQFGFKLPWGGSWIDAITKLPNPAPNADVAQQQNDGAAANASTQSGWGRVIINGEPKAVRESTIQIIGARPGVDGSYFVDTAIHTYSRQGFVTTLEVHPDVAATVNNVGDNGYSLSKGGQAATDAADKAKQTGQPQKIRNADGSVTTFFPNGFVEIEDANGVVGGAPATK